MFRNLFIILLISLLSKPILSQQTHFNWPKGKTMGLSFTWDDGRDSQVLIGTPLLDKYGIKATFYVIPSGVERQLSNWKKAVASGHEIANHSLNHPCSGNFLWARKNALEEYSLAKMENELQAANTKIKELLGVEMTEFAYPCGQTFIGRGEKTQSYVPIIAKNFNSGRTWMDEAPNDPAYCDLSQITGMEMDGKDFEEILKLIESAKKGNLWLVLAGHDIGQTAPQTTKTEMLEKLLQFLNTQSKEIWVAPVVEISKYIKSQRKI
ncbi:MAG: polysaccharide deacetylase family protein [Bacteroidota bacterium]